MLFALTPTLDVSELLLLILFVLATFPSSYVVADAAAFYVASLSTQNPTTADNPAGPRLILIAKTDFAIALQTVALVLLGGVGIFALILDPPVPFDPSRVANTQNTNLGLIAAGLLINGIVWTKARFRWASYLNRTIHARDAVLLVPPPPSAPHDTDPLDTAETNAHTNDTLGHQDTEVLGVFPAPSQ